MKVIIVYELRNREYDNALLLKCELEKRGYQVEILYKPELFKALFKECIILVPNCYITPDYEKYIYSLNSRNNVIIDLQYEQVLSRKMEQVGFHNPKGKAMDIVHLCWGENAYDRLVNNGIVESNLRITGALQLDFLRPKFEEFWYPKEYIAEKYNLPLDKKWLFYISSFSFVDNKYIIDKTEESVGDKEFLNDFASLSSKSQIETLNWFEKLLNENEDIIIIYRKHPVENENLRIKKMIQKYRGKFFCISDLSVKQWIISSDLVLTWFSTSIVECYMANKPCLILRPYKIPEFQDAAVYINCQSIGDYNKFEENICNYLSNGDRFEFPIDKNIVNEYYDIGTKPAYIRICDVIDEFCEENVNNNISINFIISRIKHLIANQTISKIIIKSIYKVLHERLKFKITNEKIRQKFALNDWETNASNRRKYKNDYENKIHKLNKIIKGN